MRTQAIVVALLFGSALVVVGCLAASYLVLSHAVRALPQTFTAPLSASLPTRIAAQVQDEEPSASPEQTEGERAMQRATQADPDIAKLLDDDDARVRSAMRAFFADDPKP